MPLTVPSPLLLFPLQAVLFPDALLGLKVFEARYLDLMGECMRTGQPFGVICLLQGTEVSVSTTSGSTSSAARSDKVQLEDVGVLARIDDVDAEQPGILAVRCTGLSRFRRIGPAQQRDNGLWVCQAEAVPADTPRAPGPSMLHTVTALAEAIKKLNLHDKTPFAPPYRLDDAGWVANRWCELLPLPLAFKQKLMAMEDPVIRLLLVDGFLRDKKVVVG